MWMEKMYTCPVDKKYDIVIRSSSRSSFYFLRNEIKLTVEGKCDSNNSIL